MCIAEDEMKYKNGIAAAIQKGYQISICVKKKKYIEQVLTGIKTHEVVEFVYQKTLK